MSRIEKSLKNLCEKMTGDKANGDCICSIIDDMADKCEAGGGSGGVLTVGMVNRSLNAENFEIDKTFEEIAAAIDAGQGVQLIFDWKKKYPEVYPLDYAARDKNDGVITGICFAKTYLSRSGDNYTVWRRGFYISNDGTITQNEDQKTIS